MALFRKRQKDSHPVAASDVLASVLAGLGAAPGLGEAQARLRLLWQNWEMVMGPDLALLAHPLGHHRDLLLVGAEDAMLAQELHLMGAEMLERVNAFMECPFFNGVKVELLMGKKGLNKTATTVTHASGNTRDWRSAQKPSPPSPSAEGRFLTTMDASSPVARAYARFVRRKRNG